MNNIGPKINTKDLEMRALEVVLQTKSTSSIWFNNYILFTLFKWNQKYHVESYIAKIKKKNDNDLQKKIKSVV